MGVRAPAARSRADEGVEEERGADRRPSKRWPTRGSSSGDGNSAAAALDRGAPRRRSRGRASEPAAVRSRILRRGRSPIRVTESGRGRLLSDRGDRRGNGPRPEAAPTPTRPRVPPLLLSSYPCHLS
ncbi:hypothetical protein KM043_001545 [Ampulex compressa]|nr:hypothetical protein KM043_001545 [Ampulex compressa]